MLLELLELDELLLELDELLELELLYVATLLLELDVTTTSVLLLLDEYRSCSSVTLVTLQYSFVPAVFCALKATISHCLAQSAAVSVKSAV